jgi:uncharacterized protein DUF6624
VSEGPRPIPGLRHELLQRAEQDQRARRALGNPPTDVQWRAVAEIDAENSHWLGQIIAAHGWPGTSMAGPDGAHAAWLIAQHASAEQRRHWLPLLRAAVEAGEASTVDLAFLVDRVCTDTGLAQRYGTQWLIRDGQRRLFPLVDPTGVNARRATIGLPPLRQSEITEAWSYTDLAPPNQEPDSGNTLA